MKKKGYVGAMKQSKSAIDITQGILDVEDFCCFQSRLRTRSLSHDSIFLSEQHQSDSDPPRALSQENVHRKIQALQKRLQTQKLHLGPPPKNLPHKFHLKSSSQGVLPHPVNPILPMFCTSPPSPGVDFNTLPQFIPCLDNSAARHRMSIKPRNQRASTKSKRTSTSDGRKPCSDSMIILQHPLTESKIEDGIVVPKEMSHATSYSSHIIRPGKDLNTPAMKCPTSPLKLLKRADDHHLHAACQSKEKEESALNISFDVGSNQILKSDEEMVGKRPNSDGPTRRKRSVDHKENLYSSKLKGLEGSSVSIEYTPHLISLSTQQSHPEIDKEHNTMASNALNRSRVQDTMQEHHLQSQPLKPLLQHRNASPLDNKYEGGYTHLISLMQHSSREGNLHESTTQQRSLSFSVSSDKNPERQRTRSFTGQVEQTGGNKEHVFSLMKPSSNLKTQDLHKNAQLKSTRNDTLQTGGSEISTKPSNLTIIMSAGQDSGDSPTNKTCDMIRETQEGDEEVDKASKEMKINKHSVEKKEEMSACVLKPYTTSQADVKVKQHTTKVKTSSWLTESTTPSAIIQDSKVGPERETCTVLRSPPLYNNELFISAECPASSRIRPQSARMDQEKAGLIRFPDLQASAKSTGPPDNIRSTHVCVMETNPKQSCTKESREASTELSWMTMAREKTRSLHQLFTNTFNDFAGLQTVTEPTASPVSKISSQPSPGPLKAKHQISPVQPSEHSSISRIHPSQPPTKKSPISPAKSSINYSEVADFSLKHSFAPTSQVQTTNFSERPELRSTYSNAKLTGVYVSPTQFNPQIIPAAHQQLLERSIQQANPIQPFLPQSVTKPQLSQSLRLSLSPKQTPRQHAHQSTSPVLQHRPLGENVSPLPLRKMDWISMPQGKRPAESQAQDTGGLGSKTLLIEHWHHEKPDSVKVVDQISTPDSQTFNNQSLDDFLKVSNHSRFTELAVSPGPIRPDREVKYQKKAIPPLSPSSSSRLQSTSESQQPSWMELAKRKSMAWSDKAMD